MLLGIQLSLIVVLMTEGRFWTSTKKAWREPITFNKRIDSKDV